MVKPTVAYFSQLCYPVSLSLFVLFGLVAADKVDADGGDGLCVEALLWRKSYVEILKTSKESSVKIEAIKELTRRTKFRESCIEKNVVSDKEIIKALLETLAKDPDQKVRSRVAKYLYDSGYSSENEIKSKLISALRNERDLEVRFSIASAFWNIIEESLDKETLKSLLPILLDAVKSSKDSEVRVLAVDALGKVALHLEPRKKYIDILTESLKNDSASEVRSMAAFALIRSKSPCNSRSNSR